MDYKKIAASALALALASAMYSCGEKPAEGENSAEPATESSAQTTEATEAATEAPTEPTTEEELIPPTPVEASDPNTVDFSDGNFSFASPKTTDPDSAQGELSVVEVDGNKMLKFTDSGTSAADELVQKIEINAAALIGTENLAKVRKIELDLYADATAANLSTDDADGVKAPGWIGGGGGTVVAGDKWYQFGEFEGGEYNFEMSGAVHVTYKFALAAGGQIWSEDMTDANFLIMRWGLANEGNLYVDNIVFYDEDGNSIPLQISEAAASEETPADETAGETPASDETAAEIEINIDDELAAAEEKASEVNKFAQDAIDEAHEMAQEAAQNNG